MNFILKSPQEIMADIAKRAKELRLSQNLTQEGLSLRSGVSLGTLKRFEKSGEISIKSLIDIANALGCLSDFEQLFQNNTTATSLFDVKETKVRQRGAIKWD